MTVLSSGVCDCRAIAAYQSTLCGRGSGLSRVWFSQNTCCIALLTRKSLDLITHVHAPAPMAAAQDLERCTALERAYRDSGAMLSVPTIRDELNALTAWTDPRAEAFAPYLCTAKTIYAQVDLQKFWKLLAFLATTLRAAKRAGTVSPLAPEIRLCIDNTRRLGLEMYAETDAALDKARVQAIYEAANLQAMLTAENGVTTHHFQFTSPTLADMTGDA